MEAMRKPWTDERLDDLNARVAELSRRTDAGFAEVRAELSSIQRTMVACAIALTSGMLVGFGALIAAQG